MTQVGNARQMNREEGERIRMANAFGQPPYNLDEVQPASKNVTAGLWGVTTMWL